MREKPDMPLTPVELFRRGIEITREIHGRIEEARAYYLGRSSREPDQPLSEVFDPTRGPILRYFVQTVRTISRTRFIERFCRTAAFREFRQASEATLEELRLLAIQLALCLGVPDKTDRRRSVGQALNNPIIPKSADMQPDAQPTNRRSRGKSCKTGDKQHAQEQIQQKQKQNINLSRPQRWPVPIRFERAGLFVDLHLTRTRHLLNANQYVHTITSLKT